MRALLDVNAPSRRTFLGNLAKLSALGAITPGFAQEPASKPMPVTGVAQPALAALDNLMAGFLREQRVSGASLAVTKNSRLLYARGFGLADRQREQQVQPADLFRIASISKAITAVAVLQLAERSKLELNAPVWQTLQLPQPADARWKRVTSWHLLHHTGGWDDSVFDAMFQSARIASALAVPLPLDGQHVIRYMLGQPLQFDPGDHFAYSNFGFFLLGRVIAHISGMEYEPYVQREVLAPLGIRRMLLSKTLSAQRAATEVAYYDEKDRTAPAVVGNIGERVPLPYGAWSLETMAANGGWLGSAVDLARFACAFDSPAACPILQPKTIAMMFARPEGKAGVESGGNYPGCGWFVWPQGAQTHRAQASSNGLLAGTSTYLMRRHDGVNWAVLFNGGNGPDGKPLMLKFRDVSSAVFERIIDWPATDQFPALL